MRAEDLRDLCPHRDVVRIDFLDVHAVKEHIEELLENIGERLVGWGEAALFGDLLANPMRHRVAEPLARDAIFGLFVNRAILPDELLEDGLEIELGFLAAAPPDAGGRDEGSDGIVAAGCECSG